MSHTTTFRRTASALGATALLGMALAAPAMAAQDPGDAVPAVDATTTVNGTVNGAERERREGGIYYPQFDATPQKAATSSAPTILLMEDHSVEYVQVAAGVVAGIALAGAGAVALSRRNPRGLRPV